MHLGNIYQPLSGAFFFCSLTYTSRGNFLSKNSMSLNYYKCAIKAELFFNIIACKYCAAVALPLVLPYSTLS